MSYGIPISRHYRPRCIDNNHTSYCEVDDPKISYWPDRLLTKIAHCVYTSCYVSLFACFRHAIDYTTAVSSRIWSNIYLAWYAWLESALVWRYFTKWLLSQASLRKICSYATKLRKTVPNHGALSRYAKLRVVHAPGMPGGNVFPNTAG